MYCLSSWNRMPVCQKQGSCHSGSLLQCLEGVVGSPGCWITHGRCKSMQESGGVGAESESRTIWPEVRQIGRLNHMGHSEGFGVTWAPDVHYVDSSLWVYTYPDCLLKSLLDGTSGAYAPLGPQSVSLACATFSSRFHCQQLGVHSSPAFSNKLGRTGWQELRC